MSREEVAAFLRNVQLSLDQLGRQLDISVRQLPEVPRAQLPTFLREQKVALTKLYAEQLEEWSRFETESGLGATEQHASGGSTDEGEATEEAAAGTPFTVQLRSLEQRVAAMGGRPALGACVLPKSTPGLRTTLNATASPAAVEIMRGKVGSSEHDMTPLRKTSSEEHEAAHTPLVQLRKVDASAPHSTPGGSAGGTPGQAQLNSELAAALQKRMQLRQAQEAAAVTATP